MHCQAWLHQRVQRLSLPASPQRKQGRRLETAIPSQCLSARQLKHYPRDLQGRSSGLRCCAEESRRKMGELLASMQDLTGGHALPIMASQMHAESQPRLLPRSDTGATAQEQLDALKTLGQEGSEVLAADQVYQLGPSSCLQFACCFLSQQSQHLSHEQPISWCTCYLGRLFELLKSTELPCPLRQCQSTMPIVI